MWRVSLNSSRGGTRFAPFSHLPPFLFCAFPGVKGRQISCLPMPQRRSLGAGGLGWRLLLAAHLVPGSLSIQHPHRPSAFVPSTCRALPRTRMPASGVAMSSSLRMRVDVDVKERPSTSPLTNTPLTSTSPRTPKTSSGPIATTTTTTKTTPPIVRRDNFKHVSHADLSQDCGPYLNLGKFKLNLFGAYFMLNALLFAIPWAIVLAFQQAFIGITDKFDPARNMVDIPCRIWAAAIAIAGFSAPTISGRENIPEGPVIFVANHASWMDVPYAGMLPQNSKYFAKADLLKVPVLGPAMKLSGHVMVDRNDKRSQMEAMVSANQVLKSGTPLFLFPEGTRGKGGRLGEFKSGAFRLATKAKVPIVPISIAGTHLVMPPSVLMPHRPAWGITHIHAHPAINSEGFTDKELAQVAFDIINDALPPEQKYVPPTPPTPRTTEP